MDYARSREFSGAPELGSLQSPGEAAVMKPMDGVYHRTAANATKGRKDAVLFGGKEDRPKGGSGGKDGDKPRSSGNAGGYTGGSRT